MPPRRPAARSSGSATGLKLALIAENRFSQSYAISTGIGFHFNAGGRLQVDAPSRYWTKSWANFDKQPNSKADSAAFAKETRFRYGLTYVEIPLGLKLRKNSFRVSRWYENFNLN